MISLPKFASIESFSQEDLKGMFNHICEHVIKTKALKVKRDILKMKGTDKDLESANPTIMSLLTLIATYDLKFEFTVKYVESVEPDFSDAPEEPKTDVVKEMESQRKEITNPEAKAPVEEVKNPVSEEKKPDLNEKEIPDFD
jgi:hypothetical protein